MTHMFTRRFDIEFTEIRHFVIFVISMLSTVMFGESLNLMNGVDNLPNFPTFHRVEEKIEPIKGVLL